MQSANRTLYVKTAREIAIATVYTKNFLSVKALEVFRYILVPKYKFLFVENLMMQSYSRIIFWPTLLWSHLTIPWMIIGV